MALYARQSTLDELGLRVPTLDNPWSGEEFMAALDAAKASGKYDYALDLGMNDQGEWYPYAYLALPAVVRRRHRRPFDLPDRRRRAERRSRYGIRRMVADPCLPTAMPPARPRARPTRPMASSTARFAFQWNGNWRAVATMAEVDDVLFLPAPDFGNGGKIGAGSWQFGIAATSEHPDGASDFIEFALQDKYLAAFTDVLGLIPATASAAQLTETYKDRRSAGRVLRPLSNEQALVRPVTPGYVVQTKVFIKALADIANGADVADTLDAAVDEIDADIAKNDGYGH